VRCVHLACAVSGEKERERVRNRRASSLTYFGHKLGSTRARSLSLAPTPPLYFSVIEKPHFDLFPCSQEEKPCGAADDVDSVTDQAHLRKLVSVTKNIFVFRSKNHFGICELAPASFFGAGADRVEEKCLELGARAEEQYLNLARAHKKARSVAQINRTKANYTL
jgi:hypothetical protein